MPMSYVEYWNKREKEMDAFKIRVLATFKCGCALGYSGWGVSPKERCKEHGPRGILGGWFGLPIPPYDQLDEVAKAGIVTLSYPTEP